MCSSKEVAWDGGTTSLDRGRYPQLAKGQNQHLPVHEERMTSLHSARLLSAQLDGASTVNLTLSLIVMMIKKFSDNAIDIRKILYPARKCCPNFLKQKHPNPCCYPILCMPDNSELDHQTFLCPCPGVAFSMTPLYKLYLVQSRTCCFSIIHSETQN